MVIYLTISFSILFLLLVCSASTLEYIYKKHPLVEEYNFIKSLERNIPNDTYVISYNTPIIISIIHKKAVTPDDFFKYNEELDNIK